MATLVRLHTASPGCLRAFDTFFIAKLERFSFECLPLLRTLHFSGPNPLNIYTVTRLVRAGRLPCLAEGVLQELLLTNDHRRLRLTKFQTDVESLFGALTELPKASVERLRVGITYHYRDIADDESFESFESEIRRVEASVKACFSDVVASIDIRCVQRVEPTWSRHSLC